MEYGEYGEYQDSGASEYYAIGLTYEGDLSEWAKPPSELHSLIPIM